MLLEGAIVYSNLIALLSLGLTLTYITTSVPNFAHGSLAVFGSYFALIMFYFFDLHPYYSLPIVFFFCGILGIICYFFILRPLIRRGASIVILMISTLALDLVLLGLIGAISDAIEKSVSKSAKKFIFTMYDFEIAGLSGIFFISTALIVAILISLWFLLFKTKFGIALRATMENPTLAETMGIDVEKTRIFSWFLSSALAGLAGALLPFKQEIVPLTGGLIIVSIFSASIVGGIASISGALVGGYLIGMSESLVTYLLSTIFGIEVLLYSKVVPLLALIFALLLTPNGIVEGLRKWSRSFLT
ncbi:MAG: branched-chain amino acid ABC transporter permease [Archaeoglobaceae archaeon]|nr:branched-chain amino acid ABC transporter permease [Archaeoglobaceae archaeon]MDW8128606.1 branched-chain amino acid ABC transporter permease [Archaeoglobaceae archaeon]